MKRFLTAALAATLLPTVALAADWQAQCVTPKAVAKGNRLVVAGTRIFDKPTAGKPATVIRENIPLWAVAKQRNWLQLAGSADSSPYKDGVVIGWALESEIDYQDLRNCN
jgi:opacity protein-like surface antigen